MIPKLKNMMIISLNILFNSNLYLFQFFLELEYQKGDLIDSYIILVLNALLIPILLSESLLKLFKIYLENLSILWD